MTNNNSSKCRHCGINRDDVHLPWCRYSFPTRYHVWIEEPSTSPPQDLIQNEYQCPRCGILGGTHTKECMEFILKHSNRENTRIEYKDVHIHTTKEEPASPPQKPITPLSEVRKGVLEGLKNLTTKLEADYNDENSPSAVEQLRIVADKLACTNSSEDMMQNDAILELADRLTTLEERLTQLEIGSIVHFGKKVWKVDALDYAMGRIYCKLIEDQPNDQSNDQ